jgi:hypothetical protein
LICFLVFVYFYKTTRTSDTSNTDNTSDTEYYIRNVEPGKQYIIEKSPKPSNIRYLVDTSDLDYYKNTIEQNQVEPTPAPVPVIPRETPRGNTRIPPEFIEEIIDPWYFVIIDDNTFTTPEFEINKKIKDEAVRQTVNDPQSVHDTVIQAATRNRYKQNNQDKQENQENQDNQDNQDVILDKIINHNPDKKHKVKNVVDQIKARNATVTNFKNETEVNILVNVYLNGNDNVKDQVINELLDSSKTLGLIDCPTGVTTRIVNATYIDTPEEMPKSKPIIQQEMLQVASHFQENYKGDEDHFKDALREKYYTDYAKVMTKAEIDDTIKEWIDFV